MVKLWNIEDGKGAGNKTRKRGSIDARRSAVVGKGYAIRDFKPRRHVLAVEEYRSQSVKIRWRKACERKVYVQRRKGMCSCDKDEEIWAISERRVLLTLSSQMPENDESRKSGSDET